MSQSQNLAGNLVACYPFNDPSNPGKDISGNGMDATLCGSQLPVITETNGRQGIYLAGGANGSSYVQLPSNLLGKVSDKTGLSISAWFNSAKLDGVWERLMDFGAGMGKPYLFMTRNLRGVCFNGEDIFADMFATPTEGEWHHVVFSISGTNDGNASSAGPRVYFDGRLAADGWISQTTSGLYKKYREWWDTLAAEGNYTDNFIGHSQFPADPDYHGTVADFCVYNKALEEFEVLDILCEKLEPKRILQLARERYLKGPKAIINSDMSLATSLMEGRVAVSWSSSRPDVVSNEGKIISKVEPAGVLMTATLSIAGCTVEKKYPITVVPDGLIPAELTIHGKEVLDISPTLYGLFYEDINRAADGGIYAEMIQNRSFEDFKFDTYDFRSGANGISTGRNHTPLNFWFGEIDKCTAKNEGGLRDFFKVEDPDAAAYYIEVTDGTKIYNHGFCDDRFLPSMNLRAGECYEFSLWAKSEAAASLDAILMDADGNAVSESIHIDFAPGTNWSKYTATFKANKTVLGKIELAFTGTSCVDMISMMPQWVWGENEEGSSATAHANYLANPNYRLRRDLVQTLADMEPTFLRFPGGCISEGSYIWDNVYDWKDSVGPVELRKENFNVWGYTMTLGLGYMEYFQLAEDLGAEPLPVMACGVLCQARSDYANPAGGKLQAKYISNFTDLIDFAISTDFEDNKWAALRKEMGHEAPFGLHYLGVGNENWGSEFFASFQDFKHAIDVHMQKNYPGYPLIILSTAGAQADDRSFQKGWRFLMGYQKGDKRIRFADGEEVIERDITWYEHQKNYLETIVDEHYYRSNQYLLENVDRYNYYYRPYKDGVLDEAQVSKVFVGEYASTDKNTLAGAIAEAAMMTGFERNSDVVRLAATAPLFNKITDDANYRWTPDCIWFNDEKVWRTPTYYVQQLYAKYLGSKLLDTSYSMYSFGKKELLEPKGGITIRTTGGKVELVSLTVTASDGSTIFEQDFTQPLAASFKELPAVDGIAYYIDEPAWKDYKVELVANKLDADAEIALGAGLVIDMGDDELKRTSQVEYCLGKPWAGTGLRVIKNGVEGYKLGDYACGEFTGNQRACYDKQIAPGTYKLVVDYGYSTSGKLRAFYTGAEEQEMALIEGKLEYYVRDLFTSATADESKVYIKLVNADTFEKTCVLKLDGLNVATEAKQILLTGPADAATISNVNTADGEIIVPVESTLASVEGAYNITVPGNGLMILVLDKQ